MRYHRQELVIGKEGQRKLAKARIAVVGMGALGSVAAELLARAGVGELHLIDRDIVEETNLQRQLLYAEKDVGRWKAEAAEERLRAINPGISLLSSVDDLNHKNISTLLKDASLILDCTDNLYTRFLLDDYCLKEGKAWVHGGAIREQGNVMLIAPGMPSFRCTFAEARGLETCDTSGVLNSTTALIGSLQAHEGVRYLLGKVLGKQGEQRLIRVSLEEMRMQVIKTKKTAFAERKDFPFLDGTKMPRQLHYECSDLYQFFLDGLDFEKARKRLGTSGKVRETGNALFLDDITVFRSGKVLIKAKDEKRAKSRLSAILGM